MTTDGKYLGFGSVNLLAKVGNLHKLEDVGPYGCQSLQHLKFQDLCLSSSSINH